MWPPDVGVIAILSCQVNPLQASCHREAKRRALWPRLWRNIRQMALSLIVLVTAAMAVVALPISGQAASILKNGQCLFLFNAISVLIVRFHFLNTTKKNALIDYVSS